MGPHDIGWAIGEIKRGRNMRRPHWGTGFYVASASMPVNTYDSDAGARTYSVTVLLMVMPSLNRVQPFTCHHDDLLATDWELAQ